MASRSPRGSNTTPGWPQKTPLLKTALSRVPPASRPALFHETFYNVGAGAFVSLFGLSLAVLKSDQIFSPPGTKEHLMFVAAMLGGSSLLSPLVGYVGNRVPMRLLIIYPNLLTATLLLAAGIWKSATFFALVIGVAFVIRVFPRVGEMNMFRVFYPVTHRGAAVGWLKSVASIAGLATTVIGTLWLTWQPSLYSWVCWGVGLSLGLSAISYARIPYSRTNHFANAVAPPHQAFLSGLRVFLSDRRFVLYQIGFWLAGFANHMSHAYVAESLKEDAQASDWTVFWIVAVVPALLMAGLSPMWGRFLDQVNPMSGRAVFNGIQCVAYALHCYGGTTQQVWPFAVGSVVHAIGNSGGTINWLTGSLYFADQQRVSLYNSVHVGLTGLRGLMAPILGVLIYGGTIDTGLFRLPGLGLGATLFAVSSGLSLAGMLFMRWLGTRQWGSKEAGR